MNNSPNRHTITAVRVHPAYEGGKPHRIQFPQVIKGTLEDAIAAKEAAIAEHAADVNKFGGALFEFGLHSWHDDEPACAFDVDPLGRALMASAGRW